MARPKWVLVIYALSYLETLITQAVAIDVKDVNTIAKSVDFVRFEQLPSRLSSRLHLQVEYGCSEVSVIGIELRVFTESQDYLPVVLRTWECHPDDSPNRRIENINLPPYYGYKPGHFNKYSVTIKNCMLLAWILDPVKYLLERQRKGKSFYYSATKRVKLRLNVAPAYELPDKPMDRCLSWWLAVKTSVPYTPQCNIEPEVYKAVTFPLALSGKAYGVHRVVPVFKNAVLKKRHASSAQPPSLKFTISIWFYVTEYCVHPGHRLCSIMQRLTWDDRTMTPLIYVNQKGQTHIQMSMADGTPVAYLIDDPLPKNKWVRMVVNYYKNKYNITLNSMDSRDKPVWIKQIVMNGVKGRLWYNDSQELTVFGGTELHSAFKGYIGEATIYRRQLIPPEQIPYPDPYHKMFELGLSDRESKCMNYLTWIRSRISNYKRLLTYLIEKKSCRNPQTDFFRGSKPSDYSDSCPTFGGPRHKKYKFVHDLVRRWVLDDKQFDLVDLGEALFENATTILEEEGLLAVPKLMSPLKQASCYGNHDATYMLATLLSQGVTLKANEIQAHSYLMYGALEGHRLCLFALGNKHFHGLDGIPLDVEQAYVYYKAVADTTKADREEHKESDVFTEHIRLTDDKAVEKFTEEDGDLFQWFKHQAAQGVLSAQKDLARMMFWGSGGVKRDLAAAVEQYRVAAETGDTVAQYDYGIVLLRGQGTKKNVSEGMKYLDRAAKKGSHQAFSAIGWYALEFEKNYTKAAYYLERAHKLGNPDASHNLGSMIMMGQHPNYTGGDRVKSFEYFVAGAKRGQVDSGIMVALYNMRGHPYAPRNPLLSVDWARWVAEKNPAIGKILAQGLKAYKHQNWPAAMIYYMMAADTGLEVATFNLAYLCEENKEGLSAYLEKECIYRFFNLSTTRPFNLVDPYAYIKMGDYYWYGCERVRNPIKAAEFYTLAAQKGDMHAVFNLAFLVEQGVHIPEKLLSKIRIKRSDMANNDTLLTALYTKCSQNSKTEAYIPCSLALWRMHFLHIWSQYAVLVKLSTVVGILMAIAVTATSVYTYFRGNYITINTV